MSPLLWLPYLSFPLDADASGYAVAAYWWARGDTLYREITITRPQGIFVVFRLIELAGLDSSRGNHIVSALYATLCALALLAVAGHAWGRAVGLQAAALFAFLVATPYTEGYSTNAELFMLLPLLGALYLLLQADMAPFGGRRELWLLGGCGLLGAVATLLKPSGISILALAALWLLRRQRREAVAWRGWLRAEVALGAGAVLGFAPAIAHGLLTVPDLYFEVVLFYRLNHDSVVAGSSTEQVRAFLHSSTLLIARLPVLLVAAVGLRVPRRGETVDRRDLLRLWCLTSLGGAAMGGNWFPHYYLPLLAPLSVGVVLGLRALARQARPAQPSVFRRYARAGGWFMGLTLLIVTLLMSVLDMVRLGIMYSSSPPASAVVAGYVRERTGPGDTIYVTYQWPTIYHLARRRPATRWLYWRELQRMPGAFDEQVRRLANPRTAPRYIVKAHDFDEFGFDRDGALRAVVARDYVLETTIGEVALYRRRAVEQGR